MRIGNLGGRLVVLGSSGAIDAATASDGRFGPDPQAVFGQWAQFAAWAAGLDGAGGQPFDPAQLGAPAPAPRQAFGVGLNYSDHVREAGFTVPDQLSVFSKFPSCLAGPVSEVVLPPGGHTDWEVELVAVIGAEACNVDAADAWGHVAGLTVGQDISERITQLSGDAPQFSLGKSFAGFGPTGPWLVTPDEFADPGDLELGCSVNGTEMQKARTRDMIVPVPELIARLSAIVTLLPGDIIFTGTPAGVGMGRSPQVWLQPGDRVVSYVEGIGELRQHCVAD
jgi:2-keto-4-pentenoate hydratase/2-oxohepta-3-ene-1,7-dioic acid hydratase in catechol pathway